MCQNNLWKCQDSVKRSQSLPQMPPCTVISPFTWTRPSQIQNGPRANVCHSLIAYNSLGAAVRQALALLWIAGRSSARRLWGFLTLKGVQSVPPFLVSRHSPPVLLYRQTPSYRTRHPAPISRIMSLPNHLSPPSP